MGGPARRRSGGVSDVRLRHGALGRRRPLRRLRDDAELRAPRLAFAGLASETVVSGACGLRRRPRLTLAVLVKQPRGPGEKTGPSRKVRTPQGRVVGKPDPGKPPGKCHRNQTAQVAGPHVSSVAGKGEMVR